MTSFRCIRCLAMGLAMHCLMNSASFAQDSSWQKSSPPPAPAEIPQRSQGSWQQQPSRPPAPVNRRVRATPGPLKTTPPNARPEHRRNEKQARYQDLQQSLRNLLQEWEQSQSARDAEPPASSQTASQPPATLPSGDTETPPASLGNDHQLAAPLMPVAEEPDNVRSAGEDQPPAADTLPKDSSSAGFSQQADTSDHTRAGDLSNLASAEQALVDGPVDRVALADNLYAIGEYTLAKEMYDRVPLQKLPPDQRYWVRYQNASCLRHMGDLAQAKKELRILAGQEEADWLARSARWWLDTIDDRAELQKEIAATQQLLDRYRENRHASDIK